MFREEQDASDPLVSALGSLQDLRAELLGFSSALETDFEDFSQRVADMATRNDGYAYGRRQDERLMGTLKEWKADEKRRSLIHKFAAAAKMGLELDDSSIGSFPKPKLPRPMLLATDCPTFDISTATDYELKHSADDTDFDLCDDPSVNDGDDDGVGARSRALSRKHSRGLSRNSLLLKASMFMDSSSVTIHDELFDSRDFDLMAEATRSDSRSSALSSASGDLVDGWHFVSASYAQSQQSADMCSAAFRTSLKPLADSGGAIAGVRHHNTPADLHPYTGLDSGKGVKVFRPAAESSGLGLSGGSREAHLSKWHLKPIELSIAVLLPHLALAPEGAADVYRVLIDEQFHVADLEEMAFTPAMAQRILAARVSELERNGHITTATHSRSLSGAGVAAVGGSSVARQMRSICDEVSNGQALLLKVFRVDAVAKLKAICDKDGALHQLVKGYSANAAQIGIFAAADKEQVHDLHKLVFKDSLHFCESTDDASKKPKRPFCRFGRAVIVLKRDSAVHHANAIRAEIVGNDFTLINEKWMRLSKVQAKDMVIGSKLSAAALKKVRKRREDSSEPPEMEELAEVHTTIGDVLMRQKQEEYLTSGPLLCICVGDRYECIEEEEAAAALKLKHTASSDVNSFYRRLNQMIGSVLNGSSSKPGTSKASASGTRTGTPFPAGTGRVSDKLKRMTSSPIGGSDGGMEIGTPTTMLSSPVPLASADTIRSFYGRDDVHNVCEVTLNYSDFLKQVGVLFVAEWTEALDKWARIDLDFDNILSGVRTHSLTAVRKSVTDSGDVFAAGFGAKGRIARGKMDVFDRQLSVKMALLATASRGDEDCATRSELMSLIREAEDIIEETTTGSSGGSDEAEAHRSALRSGMFEGLLECCLRPTMDAWMLRCIFRVLRKMAVAASDFSKREVRKMLAAIHVAVVEVTEESDIKIEARSAAKLRRSGRKSPPLYANGNAQIECLESLAAIVYYAANIEEPVLGDQYSIIDLLHDNKKSATAVVTHGSSGVDKNELWHAACSLFVHMAVANYAEAELLFDVMITPQFLDENGKENTLNLIFAMIRNCSIRSGGDWRLLCCGITALTRFSSLCCDSRLCKAAIFRERDSQPGLVWCLQQPRRRRMAAAKRGADGFGLLPEVWRCSALAAECVAYLTATLDYSLVPSVHGLLVGSVLANGWDDRVQTAAMKAVDSWRIQVPSFSHDFDALELAQGVYEAVAVDAENGAVTVEDEEEDGDSATEKVLRKLLQSKMQVFATIALKNTRPVVSALLRACLLAFRTFERWDIAARSRKVTGGRKAVASSMEAKCAICKTAAFTTRMEISKMSLKKQTTADSTMSSSTLSVAPLSERFTHERRPTTSDRFEKLARTKVYLTCCREARFHRKCLRETMEADNNKCPCCRRLVEEMCDVRSVNDIIVVTDDCESKDSLMDSRMRGAVDGDALDSQLLSAKWSRICELLLENVILLVTCLRTVEQTTADVSAEMASYWKRQFSEAAVADNRCAILQTVVIDCLSSKEGGEGNCWKLVIESGSERIRGLKWYLRCMDRKKVQIAIQLLTSLIKKSKVASVRELALSVLKHRFQKVWTEREALGFCERCEGVFETDAATIKSVVQMREALKGKHTLDKQQFVALKKRIPALSNFGAVIGMLTKMYSEAVGAKHGVPLDISRLLLALCKECFERGVQLEPELSKLCLAQIDRELMYVSTDARRSEWAMTLESVKQHIVQLQKK